MTPDHINNAAVAIGTALVGVGVGAAFGWPFGLIALGSLLVVLGLVALYC
jgi:hypothetical protein